jgi:hypothetical protein
VDSQCLRCSFEGFHEDLVRQDAIAHLSLQLGFRRCRIWVFSHRPGVLKATI